MSLAYFLVSSILTIGSGLSYIHNYRIVVLSDLISMVHGLLTGISANQVTTV
jgi:hypothetical protein